MRSLAAMPPCAAPHDAARWPPPATATALPPPRVRQRRRCGVPPLACVAAADGATADPQPPPLRVTLRTAEARASLRFESARGAHGGSYVIVSAVALESEAHGLGVRPGDRVLALSDPVRPTVLWELKENASLRFVKDALRLRVAPEVEMLLQPCADTDALVAPSGMAVPTARPGLTVGQALEEAYAKQQDATALPTVSQRCAHSFALRPSTRLQEPAAAHVMSSCFDTCGAAGAFSAARSTWTRCHSATTQASSPPLLPWCWPRRSPSWRSPLQTAG
jgi:hypothetical protein